MVFSGGVRVCSGWGCFSVVVVVVGCVWVGIERGSVSMVSSEGRTFWLSERQLRREVREDSNAARVSRQRLMKSLSCSVVSVLGSGNWILREV